MRGSAAESVALPARTVGRRGYGRGLPRRGVTLGRTVALKFRSPSTQSTDPPRRFLDSLRRLWTTPTSARFEVGRSTTVLVPRNEYAETLQDRLTSAGALPVAQALDIAGQIARSLACAHVRIVHRDSARERHANHGRNDSRSGLRLTKSRDQTMTASGLSWNDRVPVPGANVQRNVDGRADLWNMS
jgi:hypothetical protein